MEYLEFASYQLLNNRLSDSYCIDRCMTILFVDVYHEAMHMFIQNSARLCSKLDSWENSDQSPAPRKVSRQNLKNIIESTTSNLPASQLVCVFEKVV